MSLTTSPAAELQVATFARVDEREFSRAEQLLAAERTWFADAPRYATNDDIERAAHAGELREVKNSEGFAVSARFATNRGKFKPYLRPAAVAMLEEWSALTRNLLADEGIDVGPLRFAVTSMVRSQAYQDELRSDPTRLAVADSSHCVGMAFDVDAAGYYIQDDEGLISVGVPERAPAQQALVGQMQTAGFAETEIPRFDYDAYDPEVNRAGMYAASMLMEREGRLNFLLEFADTPNACMHMAANPNI